MTRLADLLGQLARGEPVTLAAIVAAIAGALGTATTDGNVETAIQAVAALLALLLARHATTPAANPVAPVKVITLENGEHLVDDRRPVITLRGRRRS